MRTLAAVTILCILSMSLVGCGGGSTSVPRGISVSITPSSVNVAISQSRLFNATVNNDDSGKGVTWNLTGTGCSGVECGSLTAALCRQIDVAHAAGTQRRFDFV